MSSLCQKKQLWHVGEQTWDAVSFWDRADGLLSVSLESSLRPWALAHVFCLIFVVWQGALSCWEKQLFRWEAYGEGTSTRMVRSKFSQQTLQRVFLMFWLISVYCTFTPITSATVEMEQMEKIPSMKKLESLELNTTKLSSNLVRMSSPLLPH